MLDKTNNKLSENQAYLLNFLKTKHFESKSLCPILLFDKIASDPLAGIAYDQLTPMEEYEIIKAFGEWGLNHV